VWPAMEAARGWGRPRQVVPTCQWLCEREGGREAGAGGPRGPKVNWAAMKKREGAGPRPGWVGWFCFFSNPFSNQFQTFLNSNILQVFKFKF
jgi:hypothetical protein